MKPYGKNVAVLLVEGRKRKGISQKQLGITLGYKCDGQYISNAERGKNNLAPKLVARVSEILEIPIEDLSNALIADVIACTRYEIQRGVDEFLDNADQGNFAIVPIRRKARLADVANLGLLQ
jgi:transcriptional regulator with XRE-family HTH domain